MIWNILSSSWGHKMVQHGRRKEERDSLPLPPLEPCPWAKKQQSQHIMTSDKSYRLLIAGRRGNSVQMQS